MRVYASAGQKHSLNCFSRPSITPSSSSSTLPNLKVHPCGTCGTLTLCLQMSHQSQDHHKNNPKLHHGATQSCTLSYSHCLAVRTILEHFQRSVWVAVSIHPFNTSVELPGSIQAVCTGIVKDWCTTLDLRGRSSLQQQF